jgi:TonB-dependent starch-binding outer membrane protein SusC
MKKYFTNHSLYWEAIKGGIRIFMKLSLVQLTIGVIFSGLAIAHDNHAQEVLSREVSLTLKEVTIKEVLHELELATKVKFVYSRNYLRLDDKVTVEAEKRKLGEILDELFAIRKIDYRVQEGNDYIVLKESKSLVTTSSQPQDQTIFFAATQQSIVVTGTVKDEKGDAVPGVNVVEKGTTNGASTDATGKYIVSVSGENSVLVFSFIGFKTQEVKVGNQTTLDVKLESDLTELDEVVVVGYGVQQRKDIIGAISSVKGDELNKIPVAGLDQALQGRAAGVVITQNSGDPGGGVSIRIRGVGTQRNNEPLYVIDGFPVSSDNLSSAGYNGSSATANNGNKDGSSAGQPSNVLSTINPNDIESIEVLKDASAAAIYGSRAANGVVLITTKRGKEGKARLNIDSYYGVSESLNLPKLLNSSQFTELATEYFTATTQPQRIDPAWKTNSVNTNWFNESFQAAPIQNHNISLSAGNQSTKAALSVNYFKQEGIIINSDFDRYSFRANLDQKISQRLKIGNSLTFTRSKSRETSSGDFSPSGLFPQMFSSLPIWPVKNDDGSYYQPSYYGSNIPNTLANPVARLANDKYNLTRSRLLGSLFAEYNILPGLTYKINTGIDYITSSRQNDKPTYPGAALFRKGVYTLEEFRSEEIIWLIENTLNYTKSIGKHNFTVLGGITAQKSSFSNIAASSNSETPIKSLSATVTTNRKLAASIYNEWSLLSYLGRFNYSYADKYLFTATIRRDGSSRFGTNNKWGVFPSFSAGWRVSEEGFLKESSLISDIKLRASWGNLGNQEIGLYDYLATLSPDRAAYTFGEGQSLQPGVFVDNLGNNSLRWETSTQTNFGIDASFLQNRILLTVDYFTKSTKDLLVPVNVPTTSGVYSVTRNAGEVRNKGLEMALTYQGKVSSFTYNVSANGTILENEVISLADPNQALSPGQVAFSGPSVTRIQAGYPLGYFFGYIMDGIFQNDAEVTSHAKQNAKPGDIRFRDINGRDADGKLTGKPDGQINGDDQTNIGSPIPKFTYGFNTTLGYKNFDLSVFFYGVTGNQIYNATRAYTNGGGENNALAEAYNRWTGEGTSNTIPRNAPSANDNYRNSSFYIEDGSYLRLRNLQIGYNLPKSLIGKSGIERFRIYASGQNLFTVTNYSGFDPEVGSFNQSSSYSGYDLGRYPSARTYLIGVNVQF